MLVFWYTGDMKTFTQKVYDVVAQIPEGRVMTYGAVARVAGAPGAARAVGSAMNRNPDLKSVPCHRVVRSDHTIGGYAFGSDKKHQKLTKEGIAFLSDGIHIAKVSILDKIVKK